MKILPKPFRKSPSSVSRVQLDKTFEEQMAGADKEIKILYQDLANYILSLGDDISEAHLKHYAAFKKIHNIVTVIALKKKLIINLLLDVSTVTFEEYFPGNVTIIGHWGCGAVEAHLKNKADFKKAEALIDRAYNKN